MICTRGFLAFSMTFKKEKQKNIKYGWPTFVVPPRTTTRTRTTDWSWTLTINSAVHAVRSLTLELSRKCSRLFQGPLIDGHVFSVIIKNIALYSIINRFIITLSTRSPIIKESHRITILTVWWATEIDLNFYCSDANASFS